MIYRTKDTLHNAGEIKQVRVLDATDAALICETVCNIPEPTRGDAWAQTQKPSQ